MLFLQCLDKAQWACYDVIQSLEKEQSTMPHIPLRVSAEEKSWMESYANIQGLSISDALKELFIEKMEDEYDLKIIKEHEEAVAKGEVEYFTFDEVKKELGLS